MSLNGNSLKQALFARKTLYNPHGDHNQSWIIKLKATIAALNMFLKKTNKQNNKKQAQLRATANRLGCLISIDVKTWNIHFSNVLCITCIFNQNGYNKAISMMRVGPVWTYFRENQVERLLCCFLSEFGKGDNIIFVKISLCRISSHLFW